MAAGSDEGGGESIKVSLRCFVYWYNFWDKLQLCVAMAVSAKCAFYL